MIKNILIFVLALFLFSCGQKEINDVPSQSGKSIASDLIRSAMEPRTFGGEKATDQVTLEVMEASMVNLITKDENLGNVLGIWTGSFGKNKINISLTDIAGKVVSGYSVCAGNFRKIIGSVETNDDISFHFEMSESGDDKHDGVFDFKIDLEKMKLEGSWEPYKWEGNSAKVYELAKVKFKYDPTVGSFPDASQRILEHSDIENYNEEELSKIRNEIYARHGYSFKNKEWRYYFENLDWYVPMGIDIRDKLTDVEVQNIELIYEYESYYDEEYDDYGR